MNDMNDGSEVTMQEEIIDIPHETTLTDEYLAGPESIASIAAKEEGSMADKPVFSPLTANEMNGGIEQYQRINVPQHRLTPLKNHWMDIYTPIVEHMKLNIRYDPKRRCIELKSCELTETHTAIRKAADYCRAFCLGFEVRDAIALLRLDDLYIDSFELKDVKIFHGEHLSRAIGRIAGYGGKTKYTIENATKTRIVIADTHVHILGSFQNIHCAKDALVRLIIGSPPGKIYNQMSNVANRNKTRF